MLFNPAVWFLCAVQLRFNICIKSRCLIGVDDDYFGGGGGNIARTLTDVSDGGWRILLQVYACCCFCKGLPNSTFKAVLEHECRPNSDSLCSSFTWPTGGSGEVGKMSVSLAWKKKTPSHADCIQVLNLMILALALKGNGWDRVSITDIWKGPQILKTYFVTDKRMIHINIRMINKGSDTQCDSFREIFLF